MKITNSFSPAEAMICLSHRLELIADKYIFKPMGLSSISVKILMLLKNGSQMTVSELIKKTGATKSNMSQRLTFLEKEQYITRNYASDSNDKRKVLIKLTFSGKKRIIDLKKRLEKAQISFEKKFTAKEVSQHKDFIKKMNLILDNEEDKLEKIFKF
ncbi:MAG: transcriptional regulator [Candidatus Moranbacteria bacterium]|jgi:DNA-binding MarR family transcriptional regulator|nr:transcriptional regulator [Candidatus Moranbacteria bacterium]